MSMDDRTALCQALVDHYVEEGLFGAVKNVCSRMGSGVFRFWSAFATAELGNPTEAIRELTALEGDPDVALPVTACLIQTHKAIENPDRKAVSALKSKLRERSRNSNAAGLLVASRYFWHTDKAKQSRMCVEKVIQSDRRNPHALALYGWVCLSSGNDRQVQKSVQFFSTALKFKPKDPTALAGRARYYLLKGDPKRALADVDQLVVSYPDNLPALAEKANILMSMGDWDEAKRAAERILAKGSRTQPQDVEALRVIALHALTQASSPSAASSRVDDLSRAIRESEPGNHRMLFRVSRLTARLSGGQAALLRTSKKLCSRAIRLDGSNPQYPTELANQMLLEGDAKGALDTFGKALQADEDHYPALVGRLRSKVQLGKLKEAAEELEFMGESHDDGDAEVAIQVDFLKALLAWRLDKNQKKALALLGGLVKKHRALLAGAGAGAPLYVAYNPSFVMQVIRELLQFVGDDRLDKFATPSSTIKLCRGLLEELARRVPGSLFAHTELARVLFVCNELGPAQAALARIEELDGKSAPAKLMLARIHLASGANAAAAEALANALSYSFDVKAQPEYYLIKARILDSRGKPAEAMAQLEAAMKLPGVDKPSDKKPVPMRQRLAVLLDMAAVQAKLGKLNDATRCIARARANFAKLGAGDRIAVAQADLALLRGDVKGALVVLKQIRPASALYMSARVRSAEIYLKHRKQKHLYAQCYEELVRRNPTLANYMLLGQAFMRIQEPDKAIQAYEAARKAHPGDSRLQGVIGSALVATHDYARATQYYETALKAEPTNAAVAKDLAELYRQLKQPDAAIRVVQVAIQALDAKASEGEDADAALDKVALYRTLAEVLKGGGDPDAMQAALDSAKRIQETVLRRYKAARTAEAYKQQAGVATEIYRELAESYRSSGDDERARELYSKALQRDSKSEASMMALARMDLKERNLEQCEQQCMRILGVNPGNREAMMMLADLIFNRGEPQKAVKYFQQLLKRCPNEYDALANLLVLLRRSGDVKSGESFIKRAMGASTSAAFDPGMNFCEGLFYRFTNDPQKALAAFNKARKDGKWGARAIEYMIKIYLDPGNDGLFSESAEAKSDMNQQAVAAEKLVRELGALGGDDLLVQTLQCYCIMATKRKEDVDQAVLTLKSILSSDNMRMREYVPAIVAIANAYLLLKKPSKARNFLKRLTRPQMHLLEEFHDDYEQGWLLLADIHIKNGKNGNAKRLCEKCIAQNRSCGKAWELLGFIQEKETAYKHAADNYEWAWKFADESSPKIGFKLAFNYLKDGRLVDAIDVCNKVLEKYPNYPRIAKEILEKARLQLRN